MREDSPDRRTYLEIVRRNAQRLLRLVEQLMTLARVDAERISEQTPLRLNRTLNTLVESFRTLADDKRIALSFTPDVDCWIACDSESLENICVNLLSNAIKYTPEGGQIKVTVEPGDRDRVKLSVADNGVGIPQDEQAAVFERFYRASDQQEAAMGSGLGLALVKELAEAMGGAVALTSVPDHGTTVSVWLPSCGAPATGS